MAQLANPRPPAVYRNIDKQTMYATVEGQSRKARLVWSLRDQNPRISVYPNTTAQGEKPIMINAPMTPNGVQALLSKIMEIAQGPNGKKMAMKCETSRMVEGSQERERIHAADVWFGKDDEGVVWITVRSAGRPDIRFDFMIDDYQSFIVTDGKPMPKTDASVLETMVACKSLSQVYAQFCNQPMGSAPAQSEPAAPERTATGKGPTTMDFDDLPY